MNLQIAKSCVQVFELSPEYMRDLEKRNRGGNVLMIGYCVPGDEPITMGYVAKRVAGTYWWFTTNPNIFCGVQLEPYDDMMDAAKDICTYVAKEIVRVFNLSKPVYTHELPEITMRRSDIKVCELTNSEPTSFQAGMDWAFRTCGIPRRPTWAKFLAQNWDKSFTWFEEQPTADQNQKVWKSESGRSQPVLLEHEAAPPNTPNLWYKSIRRIK